MNCKLISSSKSISLILILLSAACTPPSTPPSSAESEAEMDSPDAPVTRSPLAHREHDPWFSSIFGGGGYLQNLVPAPSDPRILYTYVDVGGVYRSEDGGLTWRMLHGGLPPGDGYYSVRGLEVHPEHPDWIVIAVGNQWTPRKGVFLSRDAGVSWEKVLEAQVYGNEPHRSMGFIFARDAGNRLHFASAGDGVWISPDHGLTWERTGLEGINVTDLTFAGDGRGWISAQAWTPFNAEPLKGGFYFTEDHGDSWQLLEGPAPDELVVDSDGSLVGIFDAGRILRSADGGLSWQPDSEGLPINPEAARDYTSESRFRAITAGPGFLLLGSSRGTLYRRKTGETLWEKIERREVTELVEGEPWWGRLQPGVWPHFGAALGSITVMPADPDHWWFTDWYSAYETRDAGRTWTQRIDGIEVTVIHHVLANPADPARIHVGMADNAYAQSTDGGTRYRTPKKTFSNIKMLGVSPALPGRLYAVGDERAEWRAEKLWVSTDSGDSWWSAPMQGLPPRAAHSMNSIAVHPENPYELYLGLSGKIGQGGGVYRSVDGGRSFSPVNEGLPEGENLFRHEIWSIGPELVLSASGQLVLASNDAGLLMYFDGTRWRKSATQPAGSPRYLAAAGDHFYAACGAGGLLHSRDGGRSWEKRLEGDVRVVTADPENPLLIAAATVENLHISRDGGETWTRHPLPPQAQVRTLAFGGPRLHAGTAGGGLFWMTHDQTRSLPAEAAPPGPGTLPVREDLAAELPQLEDPAFELPETVRNRWSRWTGSGTGELTWSEASAGGTGGSLQLTASGEAAHTSAGFVFDAVENLFTLSLAWKAETEERLDVELAVRSYQKGQQTAWLTLFRSTEFPETWTEIRRGVQLAPGAERGELVLVLRGQGTVWIDELAVSLPPQIFGTPQTDAEAAD
jgi:photosystem II stability/assembly factor-like uncharacterized protein